MFRTAAIRSVARATFAPAVRRTALVAAPRVATPMVLRAQSFVPVRMYSAGGGLKKEEVEGRIMSLLQGFDKVRLSHACFGRTQSCIGERDGYVFAGQEKLPGYSIESMAIDELSQCRGGVPYPRR